MMEVSPKRRQHQSWAFLPPTRLISFPQGKAADGSSSPVVAASLPALSQTQHAPTGEGEIFRLPGRLSE